LRSRITYSASRPLIAFDQLFAPRLIEVRNLLDEVLRGRDEAETGEVPLRVELTVQGRHAVVEPVPFLKKWYRSRVTGVSIPLRTEEAAHVQVDQHGVGVARQSQRGGSRPRWSWPTPPLPEEIGIIRFSALTDSAQRAQVASTGRAARKSCPRAWSHPTWPS